MVKAPVSILGGLPVIADVWSTRGDGWTTDDDAGVNHLYWHTKRSYEDPTKHGKEIPQSIYDRLDKTDAYWEVSVTEQAFDWLSHRDWLLQQGRTNGSGDPGILDLGPGASDE